MSATDPLEAALEHLPRKAGETFGESAIRLLGELAELRAAVWDGADKGIPTQAIIDRAKVAQVAVGGARLKSQSWTEMESDIRRSRPPGCRRLPLMLLQMEAAWMARERSQHHDKNGALLAAAFSERIGELIQELAK